MSSINEKLGLRRAGKRRMMNLPKDAAARNDLTAAKCPNCGRGGVLEYVSFRERKRQCRWCSETWLVQ